jgi:flagellar L-ring protein precursor FlgH
MLKTSLLTFTLIGTTLFVSGCTANLADPEIDFKPPAYVEQMPSKHDQTNYVSTGSIFGQGDSPLFSDHKAMHVNDIVTVAISESAKSSSTGAKQLNKSNDSTLGGGLFSSTGASANSTMNSAMNKINGFTDIGFNSKTNSVFKGQSSATKNSNFDTTISARIVKVLENGNYFISGRREILVDEQKQIIQISGVIRPYDIDQNNNVNSSQISDAKILYKTEGDVDRSNKQGWGSKLIEAVWPF